MNSINFRNSSIISFFLAVCSLNALACPPCDFKTLLDEEKKCYDIEFTQQHIACMQASHKSLITHVTKQLKWVYRKQPVAMRQQADAALRKRLSNNEATCKAEMVAFGPGTLGPKRYAFCLNEGIKALEKEISTTDSDFLNVN